MLIQGHLTTSKPLDKNVADVLNALSDTQRYARNTQIIGNTYGLEGEFYTVEETDSILQPPRPPVAQPSMELNWYINETGTELHYREMAESLPVHSEKWLQYLISKFFQPKGIALNGQVKFIHADTKEDLLTLAVQQNQIKMI